MNPLIRVEQVGKVFGEAPTQTVALRDVSLHISKGEFVAAIARALVNNPSVIFADEPTGNLDSKSGQVVMEIIRRLNDEGHTVVLITHETYTAENAKRIIRLKDGVIESDTQVAQRASLEKFSK